MEEQCKHPYWHVKDTFNGNLANTIPLVNVQCDKCGLVGTVMPVVLDSEIEWRSVPAGLK